MKHQQLIDLIGEACDARGLRWRHVRDSRWAQGVPGWPDLEIIGAALIWREIKVGGDIMRPDQNATARALRRAGQDFAVWTEHDWATKRIDTELDALMRAAAA